MHALPGRRSQLLHAAYRALLSPLDFRDSASWRESVTQAVSAAVEVDVVGCVLPSPDGPLIVSNGSYDQKSLDEYGAYFHHHNPVDLRRLGPGRNVWVREELCPTADFVATEYYNDWCRPYGNLDSAGMRTRFGKTEKDESFLALNSRRSDRFRPGCRAVDILAFLQPAFAAGVRLALLGPRLRLDWSVMLDALPLPGFLIGVSGCVLHVSQRGRAMLEADRDQAGFFSILRAWARGFGGRAGDPAPARRVVDRPNGRLIIRASLLSVGPLVGQEPIVLFTAEAQESPRPTARQTLRERYFVTRREGEVAELIAEGLGTREIADRLGISIHTARRHSEHLFSKLGVRRRAEVAALIARLG